jgi:hypothetical protein
MQTNRQVRVIKRGERASVGDDVEAVATQAGEVAPTERDVRAVVSGWVREHREGVRDYRSALATLFSRLDVGASGVAAPASR